MSEFILAIGDDNVKFQSLDRSLVDAIYSVKSGTNITFSTEIPLTFDGTKDFGLILWLDRDAVKAALNKAAK